MYTELAQTKDCLMATTPRPDIVFVLWGGYRFGTNQ